MITFKQFILEYSLDKHMSIIPGNGKDPNRAHMRKNVNTVNKQHTYNSNVVDEFLNGKENIKNVTSAEIEDIVTGYEGLSMPESGTSVRIGRSKAKLNVNADGTGTLTRI